MARAPHEPQARQGRADDDAPSAVRPALLGNVLPGDSWRPWRIVLIAAMGETLDDEERAIFRGLTGRFAEPGESVDELWAVVGRRGALAYDQHRAMVDEHGDETRSGQQWRGSCRPKSSP
jgi:hypothetical protein